MVRLATQSRRHRGHSRRSPSGRRPESAERGRAIDPARRQRGVDREARRQRVSLRLGYVQPIEIGPGTLGVDMVGGDGGDTTLVADAGIEEISEVVGEVCGAWTWTSSGRIIRASAIASR